MPQPGADCADGRTAMVQHGGMQLEQACVQEAEVRGTGQVLLSYLDFGVYHE